jgi:hypothetical protein
MLPVPPMTSSFNGMCVVDSREQPVEDTMRVTMKP